MASINTIVKRKQYLWLGIVVVGAASAIGGALYLSDVDMSGNGEAVAEQEPVPDMTGVVDTTFDDKVRQHATTEMQVTAAQMQKQYEEIRRELDVLNKQRGDDQRRIEKLGQDNAALAEQVKALGANPVTATGEPVPQTPASPPGPEGEPQPGNTPVSFPPQGSVAVPPPTAFYPGNGVTPPPQVTYQSVPVPNRIQRKVFTRNEGKQGPSLPYIPSGSFAKAMLIEGADANASVTGNESTVPMQLRITGLVEMPNSKTYDATGCFVGLEAWGDVSSERAIVRTRNISCLKNGKTIDMPIKGHVSFRGKNGIKGEVVMRNGKILGWAWGAGFVDGIGQGMERASQPAVGLGATAAYGANAKFFTGFWVKNFVGCSFTLDSQCGRLWLYQPPATGTHTGVWHPAGNEQGPAATTKSACAKRRCALHPGGLLPGWALSFVLLLLTERRLPRIISSDLSIQT